MIYQRIEEYKAMLEVKRSVEYTLNQLRTSVIIDRKSWILSLEKIQKQIEVWETGGYDGKTN